MANRRMFAQGVVESDRFLDMPLSAQALYFHLGMYGDDDGFVGSPKKIQRSCSAADDDLKLLIAKGYILPFESGVIVITNWRENNQLRPDRHSNTRYVAEARTLNILADKSYSFDSGTPLIKSAATNGIPDGNQAATQYSIDKYSIGESRRTDASASAHTRKKKPKEPTKDYGRYGRVRLTDDAYARLLNDLGETELNRCIAYIDESAQSTNNKNGWKDWNVVIRRCSRGQWGLSGVAGAADVQSPTERDYGGYDPNDPYGMNVNYGG